MATSKIEKIQLENAVANISSSVTYNSKLTTGGQRAKVYTYGTTRKLAVCTFNLGLPSGSSIAANEVILSGLPKPNTQQSTIGVFGTTATRLIIKTDGTMILDGVNFTASGTQYLNASITYVIAT
jgi:hypothetical protein